MLGERVQVEEARTLDRTPGLPPGKGGAQGEQSQRIPREARQLEGRWGLGAPHQGIQWGERYSKRQRSTLSKAASVLLQKHPESDHWMDLETRCGVLGCGGDFGDHW